MSCRISAGLGPSEPSAIHYHPSTTNQSPTPQQGWVNSDTQGHRHPNAIELSTLKFQTGNFLWLGQICFSFSGLALALDIEPDLELEPPRWWRRGEGRRWRSTRPGREKIKAGMHIYLRTSSEQKRPAGNIILRVVWGWSVPSDAFGWVPRYWRVRLYHGRQTLRKDFTEHWAYLAARNCPWRASWSGCI